MKKYMLLLEAEEGITSEIKEILKLVNPLVGVKQGLPGIWGAKQYWEGKSLLTEKLEPHPPQDF